MVPIAKKLSDNERTAWAQLPMGQKSYVVRVLDWFHYRSPQIARSWMREEVLTWEMLRALAILPRRVFLGPLLHRVGERNPSILELARHLLSALGSVEVDEYPSFGLSGALHNRAGDIGLRHPDGTRLWLEAKTVVVPLQELLQQLIDQQEALNRITRSEASRVVALVPKAQPAPDCPMIRWGDVASVLEEAQQLLEGTKALSGDMDGYLLVTRELSDRILTHPNRIAF